MNRQTLVAFALCFLIFASWNTLVAPKFAPPPIAQNPTQITNQTPPSLGQQPSSSPGTSTQKTLPKQPEQVISLPTGTGEAIVGDASSFFVGWNLKSYKLDLSPADASVDMNSVTHQKGEVTLAFDDENFNYLREVQGKLVKTPTGAHWSYEDDLVKLSREFLSSEQNPYVDVQVTAEFKKQSPKYAFISIFSQSSEKDPESQDRHLVYWTNQALEDLALGEQVSQKGIVTPVKFIGATNRYFVMATVARSPLEATAVAQPAGPYTGRLSLVYPITSKTVSIPIRTYFGPKELEMLRKVEPTLANTIEFGRLSIIAFPLLTALKWLNQFVQNFGIAIILLTLGLKILTYPLTYKSMKSMKKMAKLQPQLQKLRDKHKNDKEALNREMLVLMKNGGYNPMAGCLPMIIQMPVFFALYRVLYLSIELFHAPFALWIQDLSMKDPFYVTPILLSLTMFVQQKLTPNTATDPAQQKVMQLMPLIFGAMMMNLPSGLTIYMLVNALASILQQMILNKKFDKSPA